jgi:protein involved in polysaccharide export with SLBB domain
MSLGIIPLRQRLNCSAILAAVLIGLTFATALMPSRVAAETYRLGSRDKLKITVTEWRAGKGDIHVWTALNGDYLVGASGHVSMPLLGDIEAANLTTAELSSRIANRLREVAGLLQTPSASVEIAEHRPFFVLGHVERPGEFAFRPGLTVLQAVSIAGGLYRVPDPGMLRLGRDGIQAQGELGVLEAERITLLARRDRLQSEIAGKPQAEFSNDVTANTNRQLADQAVAEEQQIFASRRAALRSQITSLQQARVLFSREAAALQDKTKTLERQLSLARRELEGVNELVNRGLAVTARRLALEQNTAQFENQMLDANLARLRANQEDNRSERGILEIENQRRAEALTQLRETQMRLSALSERITTTRQLMLETQMTGLNVMAIRNGDLARRPSYSIVRVRSGLISDASVAETDAVLPGDVLKVEQPTLNPAEATPAPVSRSLATRPAPPVQ